MLKVTVESSGPTLLLRLSGEIDESLDLKPFITGGPAELRVNCSQVTRINSPGVKSWIGFFGSPAAAKFRLTFEECSTVIVEQMNMIRNFVCHGKVESICVPFYCDKCSKSLTLVLKTQGLVVAGFNPVPIPCPCGGKAEFDDLPEEYFSFLQGRP